MTTTDGHGNDDVTQAHEPRYYGARFPFAYLSTCVVRKGSQERERKRKSIHFNKTDDRGNKNVKEQTSSFLKNVLTRYKKNVLLRESKRNVLLLPDSVDIFIMLIYFDVVFTNSKLKERM